MLKDRVRTLGYRDAIYSAKSLFRDKVVLDIGCGTAILSMFAARAGARLVIGVDMSHMIDHARTIVEKNGFADKIVLIKGRMEEVELPVPTVDIIISEWMGYFLLYESMFETVIWARDRYLASDGCMFPDNARMFICGIEDQEYKEQKIHFWNDVYGFDMSNIKTLALCEPLVDVVEAKAVVTDSVVFRELDLTTIKKEDLRFSAPFSLKCKRNDRIHAFVSYFDVSFGAAQKPSSFSTGPSSAATHWKQTVFYIEKDLVVNKGDSIDGSISCLPNAKNHRNLDIEITYSHDTTTEHLRYLMA